jgi:4-amino-4-deoxy-L-arabinose transferase-like glycosyltransferase
VDVNVQQEEESAAGRLTGRRWWLATGLVFVLALAATVPTTGDIGLTWDEPAYRFSQLRSEQWWERLVHARSMDELRALVEPDALLFYWVYGRHGINFHPPLAGQLSVLTHAAFGRWMKDVPSRRMASVLEYSLAVALAFGFLARRYGSWVGIVTAGSLLVMPRVDGDGHIAGTDTPGLFLWPATALAFWKGLYEPDARRWRVAVGVLMGLAFTEKMGAVLVLLPLLLWLVATRRWRSLTRADWLDGLLTSAALLVPLAVAFAEILRLTKQLPIPEKTNLFLEHPPARHPGMILALPLGVWVFRLIGRSFPGSTTWGAERPGLETWASILAFAPVVGWLGNPAWWRETLSRLAHYYLLNTDRRGSLPPIRILYLGRVYEYDLPWHNGWVLIGVTVPAAILAAGTLGVIYALARMRHDRLPLYFLLHFVTLPAVRMLPTPAHDGVRLFLPTFFFLAGLAGWGAVWAADGLSRLARARSKAPARALAAALVLVPSAWQLVKIHPFELSYYNELIGGPRGAYQAGLELTYWYDAFNPRTLAELNRKFPPGAGVDFMNERAMVMTFLDLHALGQIRRDVLFGWPTNEQLPYVWLLTQDSKASQFTRYLFAMEPWYALRPPQLDGLRVATVADPAAVSRAWALWLLTGTPERRAVPAGAAPGWVGQWLPWLGRFWGEGLAVEPPSRPYEPALTWARTDPDGLRAAARALAERGRAGDDPGARRLMEILADRPSERIPPDTRIPDARVLLRVRPEALVEAVDILIRHPDAVRTVLTGLMYTEPEAIGGPLDRDFVPRSR